jgi:hypothetical protein
MCCLQTPEEVNEALDIKLTIVRSEGAISHHLGGKSQLTSGNWTPRNCVRQQEFWYIYFPYCLFPIHKQNQITMLPVRSTSCIITVMNVRRPAQWRTLWSADH